MRKNRPHRRSGSNGFSRLFGKKTEQLRRAPRRRSLEQLEPRQVMSANVGGNPYFEDQWNLDANGQQTEFDPTSPTFDQTLAEIDINVIEAWEQLITGAGTQIGIISGGFDLTHEDLIGAFATDLAINTIDGTNNTAFTSTLDSNGTAVSGIIGARNNATGIVGIAYNADLVPITALPAPLLDPDTNTPVAAAPDAASIAQALRYRLGIVQDTNGDGLVDGVDNDGDGIVDGYAADEVIDVYFLSGGTLSGLGRGVERADQAILEAISDGANFGRSRWDDLDGDGIFDLDEVTSLGAIYVVPAGDDNGNGFQVADSRGFFESSQYNDLSNSRYTISVWAVDYDGRYENNASGLVTAFSEIGPNVLLVAPSGTDQQDLSAEGDGDLNSGILTTDLTGESGRNALPNVFGEVDGGDFFPDTNYTSTFGGTEAAAAQVTATVALMLEANPNLSRRDVEQILLMSASQVDQFSETWITNAYTYFEDAYVIPQWAYYDLDTDGEAGADIEGAILPNTPLINLDESDPDVIRAYFLNNPDLTFDELGFFNTEGLPLDEDGNLLTIVGSNVAINPDDLIIFGDDQVGGDIIGVDDVLSPASLDDRELLFENGVGYTVSYGFGRNFEEIGFAHGLLDAGLAVELASKWGVDSSFDDTDSGLFKGREISISTPVVDPANDFALQGRADVNLGQDLPTLAVPGGNANVPINGAFYQQFSQPLQTTEITFVGDIVGEVVTGGPFYDPNGDGLPASDRGSSFFPIVFDDTVDADFLSIESIELRAAFSTGDIDTIRVSLLSPDGTQTELNPYRLPASAINPQTPLVFQRGQYGQGSPLPGGEAISPFLGNFNIANEIINTDENFGIGGIDLPDAVPGGEVWTWTTNRHYGELFSTQAIGDAGFAVDSNGNLTTVSPTLGGDGWYIVIENWGGAASLDGYQVTVHGTEVTGQRIQGKVGIDDNAQDTPFYNIPVQTGGAATTTPTPEQLGDGVFNFERHLEFGEVIVDPAPIFDAITGEYIGFGDVLTVVLDDTTDSVDLDKLNDNDPFGAARTYRTENPITGEILSFPVVDRDAYFSVQTGILSSNLTEFDPSLAGAFVTPSLLRTDGLFFSFVNGSPDSYQNFDYSQESFAAGVTVGATQYRVDYDASGNPIGRTETGVKQRFVTGADGNYYFDVQSVPAPPDASIDPAGYAIWFSDFGFTLEYDVEVVGEEDRVWDREYTIDDQEDPRSQVEYVGGGVYTVQLFDAENVIGGETTTVRDVNFLLAEDLTESFVNVSGTLVRDNDGNTVLSPTDGRFEGIRVYYDANDNDIFDAGELNVLSEADGTYALPPFLVDDSESVSIRLDPTTYPENLIALRPTDEAGEAERFFDEIEFEPGDNLTADFFLQSTNSFVQGTIFRDANENRIFDAGEEVVNGTVVGRDGSTPAVFVYVDANNNGVFDAGEQTSAVAEDGTYSFTFDIAGNTPVDFAIRLDLTNAFVTQTFPTGGAEQIVSLVSMQTIDGVNFGVQDLRVFDFGDLPDSYGTLLDSNGARHQVRTTSYLGSSLPDIELDAFSTFNADGDDNNEIDDEDGVTFTSAGVVANSTIEFDIVANGAGAVLNAWVDFNNDGVFSADEQIFDDEGNLGTGTTMSISAPTPAFVAPADRYAARFRWGPFGLGPTGPANDGEVEDLWLTPDAIVVSGTVRLDADNDAVNEITDTPSRGVRVFIDENLDGIRNPNEPSSVTDADGNYSFEVVPDGNDTPINIRVEQSTLSPNTGFLDPESGIINDLGDPGELITADFLLTVIPRPTQVITGSVFGDLDNDGVTDAGETGLEGITVELLRNIDADPEFEVIATTQTNPSGVYSFPVDDTGQYEVRVVLPAGGTQIVTTTGGDTRQTAVQTGQTVTVPAFGVFDIRSTFTRDYGDLQVGGGDAYRTTAVQGGPSHFVDGVNFLGSGVDADNGSLSSFNASADDNDFTDDEDGVRLLSDEIVAGQEFSFNITATGDSTSRLNVWVDFDDNGVFDTDERIVSDLALASGETTQINRIANADTSDTAAVLAVRARWGTAGVGPDDFGLEQAEIDAIVGEVEDHFFRTSQPGTFTDPGAIVGDFNGNGEVTLADRAVWRDSYGQVGENLPADANGDGRVDAADFAIWRDAMDATPPLATATSGDDSSSSAPLALATAIPQPVQMPIVETEPEPVFEQVSFDANAFAPLAVVDSRTASAIDESLSVEEETAEADGSAIEAALLEWSLEGDAGTEATPIEALDGDDEGDEEVAEDALAAAFAF